MSNLSELLPTGGGQNAVDFVASGTLSSGQTVVLNSDGTVSAVAESSIAKQLGSTNTISEPVSAASGIYIPELNKVVFATSWIDSVPYPPFVIGNLQVFVGEVSGTSITFGSGNAISINDYLNKVPAIAYDSANDKIMLCYDENNTKAVGIVGTISGTSITFGTPVTNSTPSTWSEGAFGAYNPVIGRCEFFFRDQANNRLYRYAGTYSSGNSATWSLSNYSRSNTNPTDVLYDTDTNKTMLLAYDSSTSTNPTIAADSTVYNYDNTVGGYNSSFAKIPNTNNFIITYKGISNYLTAKIVSYDGVSFSSGSAYVLNSNAIVNPNTSVSWNEKSNSAYVVWKIGSTTTVSGLELFVSGTVITTGSVDSVLTSIGTTGEWPVVVYDSTNFVNVAAYGGANSSGNFKIRPIRLASSETNSADFIGITAEAISDTATGAVNVYGGINEAQTGLTIGADYYVQDDGTLSTTASSVKVGQAISATTINMMDLT